MRGPVRRDEGSSLAPGTPFAGPSKVLPDAAVKGRAAVAEEAEGGAVLPCQSQIEDCVDDAGLLGAEFGEDVAAFVADERVAVEALVAALRPAFGADAVGSDD